MQPPQKTDQRISMPPRSERPGFKRGRKGHPYWVASQVVRDPMGFPDKCIQLPVVADDAEINRLCVENTARLLAWVDDQRAGRGPNMRYDGSVLTACQLYQRHPYSPFHGVSHKTRKSAYLPSLKILEATVGKRLIRNVTVIDVRHWYAEWRKPVVKIMPDGTKIVGPERIDRAHDAVAMFRTVIRFLAAMRHPECRLLADELSKVQFEKGGAREEEMTFVQAAAFVKAAFDLEDRKILPPDRGLYMAIGIAAQFDLALRQKDVIGSYAPASPAPKLPKGAATLNLGDELWAGFFTWENIPGWRWRMRTSKSKYRSPMDFDLSLYDRLLFPLLERVPHEDRIGAIVKGENGLPVRERSYRRWYRQIARAAGIPDEVWCMDTRAGAATEAEEAGVDERLIQEIDDPQRCAHHRAVYPASVEEGRCRCPGAE